MGPVGGHRDKWTAGTEPNNSNSIFQAAGVDGTRQVGVQTLSGRRYSLYAASKLIEPDWHPVPGETNIPGTGGRVFLSGPTGFPIRLFRVGVE